jgi:hypothetical protein
LGWRKLVADKRQLRGIHSNNTWPWQGQRIQGRRERHHLREEGNERADFHSRQMNRAYAGDAQFGRMTLLSAGWSMENTDPSKKNLPIKRVTPFSSKTANRAVPANMRDLLECF